MKVTLSGGQFGGVVVNWPENQKTEIVSLKHGKDYWNYNIVIHSDSAFRADFTGCSKEPGGVVIEINA